MPKNKEYFSLNLLEAMALLTLVRRLCSSKVRQSRVLVLVDSAVLKGAATKGRSSSFRLNRLLRKLTAYLLGFDIYVELLWIQSDANPADAPSPASTITESQAHCCIRNHHSKF